MESIDRVTVQPRVSGNIVATRFREGNVVRQGDLLFEIEDTRYKAAVEEAEAKKAQLEAKLLYARNSFERYNKLLASKSVSMDHHGPHREGHVFHGQLHHPHFRLPGDHHGH